MTAILCLVCLAIGFVAGWWVCSRRHQALRLDRDLHEQDSLTRRDAAWRLSGENQTLRDLVEHAR